MGGGNIKILRAIKGNLSALFVTYYPYLFVNRRFDNFQKVVKSKPLFQTFGSLIGNPFSVKAIIFISLPVLAMTACTGLAPSVLGRLT
jgi:hypothetical protein